MSEKKGGIAGTSWGAVIELTIHAPATRVQVKEETNKVAQAHGADPKAVALMAERIPTLYARALRNAGTAIRNHIERTAIKLNGQYIVPLPILPKLWNDLFGHSDLSSTECVGHTGYMCKYNACKAALMEACRAGELDRLIAETVGGLQPQIAGVDCGMLESAFGVDIILSIDVESPLVRDALDQLSANVREQVEARAQVDAERAAGQAASNITAHAVSWIGETLNDIIERIGSKGTHIASLVKRVGDLVDTLPAYNLAGDPAVTKAIHDVRERLARVMDADTLRESETARTTVIDAAKSILADLGIDAVESTKAPPPETDANPIDPLDQVNV